MTWPDPKPGLVIRYSYLWRREFLKGREEGVKDRPCAVILSSTGSGGNLVVRVLPITHALPKTEATVELPLETLLRLGLDAQRSWIVTGELNEFLRPGPDLRPRISGEPASVSYGFLPPSLFRRVRESFLQEARSERLRHVKRTE